MIASGTTVLTSMNPAACAAALTGGTSAGDGAGVATALTEGAAVVGEWRAFVAACGAPQLVLNATRSAAASNRLTARALSRVVETSRVVQTARVVETARVVAQPWDQVRSSAVRSSAAGNDHKDLGRAPSSPLPLSADSPYGEYPVDEPAIRPQSIQTVPLRVGLHATLPDMDIRIHQADGRVIHYPDATGYDLMPDAVLKVEIDGSLMFFNPGYWLQFAIDTQDPDPFNLNLNPLS